MNKNNKNEKNKRPTPNEKSSSTQAPSSTTGTTKSSTNDHSNPAQKKVCTKEVCPPNASTHSKECQNKCKDKCPEECAKACKEGTCPQECKNKCPTECKDKCSTECKDTNKNSIDSHKKKCPIHQVGFFPFVCPCDLLMTETGIHRIDSKEGKGYSIQLPNGLHKEDITASQEGNMINIKYQKEIKKDNEVSRKSGEYSFTINPSDHIEHMKLEGTQLKISVTKVNNTIPQKNTTFQIE
ncbi:hypothetical protein NEOKW01_2076 [Nematocida sp. AWRm80]|nr:hypothetical protein NEOKW01_2076 [Nematocida sp. AWRm80]